MLILVLMTQVNYLITYYSLSNITNISYYRTYLKWMVISKVEEFTNLRLYNKN